MSSREVTNSEIRLFGHGSPKLRPLAALTNDADRAGVTQLPPEMTLHRLQVSPAPPRCTAFPQTSEVLNDPTSTRATTTTINFDKMNELSNLSTESDQP
jgi:hypothetical protein